MCEMCNGLQWDVICARGDLNRVEQEVNCIAREMSCVVVSENLCVM